MTMETPTLISDLIWIRGLQTVSALRWSGPNFTHFMHFNRNIIRLNQLFLDFYPAIYAFLFRSVVFCFIISFLFELLALYEM